jgi:hypothetical protein
MARWVFRVGFTDGNGRIPPRLGVLGAVFGHDACGPVPDVGTQGSVGVAVFVLGFQRTRVTDDSFVGDVPPFPEALFLRVECDEALEAQRAKIVGHWGVP